MLLMKNWIHFHHLTHFSFRWKQSSEHSENRMSVCQCSFTNLFCKWTEIFSLTSSSYAWIAWRQSVWNGPSTALHQCCRCTVFWWLTFLCLLHFLCSCQPQANPAKSPWKWIAILHFLQTWICAVCMFCRWVFYIFLNAWPQPVHVLFQGNLAGI